MSRLNSFHKRQFAWGAGFKKLIPAILFAGTVFMICGCTENVHSKLYGGTATIKKPEAHWKLLNLTWKDTSLWSLWYDPKTNQCHFKENSPFGILQGNVIVENCDPYSVQGAANPGQSIINKN